MGSGSFGVNMRELPLSKEEYFELLELLIIYVMLPSRGYKRTLESMEELPMPAAAKETFRKRL